MKRIRVPAEILSAVMAISSKTICRYCQGSGADDHPNEPVSPFESRLHPCPACRDGNGQIDKDPKTFRREIVEAVLRYISEHPQVPTLKQLREIETCAAHEPQGSTRWLSDIITEWQRRCFVQEEPEIPEEIKDLLGMMDAYMDHDPDSPSYPRDLVFEAYRRGLRKGEKK